MQIHEMYATSTSKILKNTDELRNTDEFYSTPEIRN